MKNEALARYWRRFGLVGRFSIMSLVAMLLIGFFVARALVGGIEKNAINDSSRSTELLGQLAIEANLGPADFKGEPNPNRLEFIDVELGQAMTSGDISRVKLWTPSGRLVYSSSDRNRVGQKFRLSSSLKKALAGVPSATRIAEPIAGDSADPGPYVETVVPVWFAGQQQASGAFEIDFPYGPVQARIDREARRSVAILVAGLALLYASLFRIVLMASRRLRSQRQDAEHRATHDHLTDLPNRELFCDQGEQTLAMAAAEGLPVAVIMMDLDRFKDVNATLGHRTGDFLLEQIPLRMTQAIQGWESFARFGGDEFAFLLAPGSDAETACGATELLNHALDKPFAIEGVELDIDASFGIAVYPDHGESITELIQHADFALGVAKKTHVGVEVYEPVDDFSSTELLGLGTDLRRAIKQGQFELFYQPKLDLRSREVVSAEALLRWNHPERGLVPPLDFIGLAETTTLIRPLTLKVVEMAVQQIAKWRESGLNISVAVNLSARNLLDPQMPTDIERLLAEHGVPARSLEIEITERAAMESPQRAFEALERLRTIGLSISLDDFGTGYSSLSHLQKLPVDTLKIDRSFVSGMCDNAGDADIVVSTIALAHNLGLATVAEGVETEEVLDKLAANGCQFIQGYFVCRPIKADDFEIWMADRDAVGV